MSRTTANRTLLHSFLALGGAALLADHATAQHVFSIDYNSNSVSLLDSWTGTPITEGDLLSPALGVPMLGPLPTPGIDVSAGFGGLGLALHPTCVGTLPGTACGVDVNAVSYGRDDVQDPAVGVLPGHIWFSTDTLAFGIPNGAPDVSSEGPCEDLAPDMLANRLWMAPGPLAPFASVGGNVATIDGDGMVSACGLVYPGIGLQEPSWYTFPPVGDVLDAYNFDGQGAVGGGFGFPATGIYFSLDGVTVNPFTLIPGSGSAAAHGFLPGDILKSTAPGGPPSVWAPAAALGLSPLDDLDALAMNENGSGAFEPSQFPHDWLAGGTDMVLFSVTIGSPVVGMPDSIFGIMIEPGDILTTPLPTALGGLSPFPGIFVAAENLNLSTHRTFGFPGDDLDALDFMQGAYRDCNGNGVDDIIDISTAFSLDVNGNTIPDECETTYSLSCFCPVAPCLNPDPAAGCENTSGQGGLLTPSGTTSVGSDDLVLTSTQLPAFMPGITFMGPGTMAPAPFWNGLLCVAPQYWRFLPVLFSGPTGTYALGPGIAAYSVANFPASAWVTPGSTWHFQSWYRDPSAGCFTGANLTNMVSATFYP